MTSAAIHLYETLIGAVTWDDARELGIFEYDPVFINSGIEVSPLTLRWTQNPGHGVAKTKL
jgi:serine/threonine-protein kinase HipA